MQSYFPKFYVKKISEYQIKIIMIFILFGTPKPRRVHYITKDLKVIDLERAVWINPYPANVENMMSS